MVLSYIEGLQTLQSVLLKREDKNQGSMINIYHTDNGIFNTSKFMEDLLKKQQKISLLGMVSQMKIGEKSAPSIWWSLYQVPY